MRIGLVFRRSCWGLVLVLLAACLPGPARGEELQIPKCEEAWCFSVAQPPSTWPAAYTGKTVEVQELPRILIDIPAGIKKIVRSDSVTLISYDGKKVLSFSEHRKEDHPDFMKAVEGTNYTLNDLMHVIFTKTPKDKEPEAAPDQAFWRLAMRFKSTYMGEPETRVFTGKKGSVTVYYKKESKPILGNQENTAIVLNEKSPNGFLQISSTNMSFDEFTKIIGTIRERIVK